MSESDTVFNVRNRRYAAVQPCSLQIKVMTARPLPAPSKCKSGLPRITGTCLGWWKQSFRLRFMFFAVVSSEGQHHATSHLRSRLENQHQCVPGCAEECGDPLVQSGGRWQTLDVTAGLGAGLQICDWDWRRLHWIDVSSYYIIKLPDLIFSIKVFKIKL